jgi:hypothetical protein
MTDQEQKEREAALRERFWSKVSKVEGGCWEWTACLHPSGYGLFGIGRRPRRAHRLSFEWANGPIPEGQLVLHDCDNRKCVNPAHLHLGDEKMNADECWSRGRGVNQHVSGGVALSGQCANGHPYDEANTSMVKGRGGRLHRRCLKCNSTKSQRHRQRIAS